MDSLRSSLNVSLDSISLDHHLSSDDGADDMNRQSDGLSDAENDPVRDDDWTTQIKAVSSDSVKSELVRKKLEAKTEGEKRPPLPDSLKGYFKREKTGGLRLTDSVALEKQKGILFDLIKQAGKSFIDGQGITGIALPVRVFSPDTLLEKYAMSWGYAPSLLSRAARLTSSLSSHSVHPSLKVRLERMKFVMAFAISSLHLCENYVSSF